jgi:hypothetical protein
MESERMLNTIQVEMMKVIDKKTSTKANKQVIVNRWRKKDSVE